MKMVNVLDLEDALSLSQVQRNVLEMKEKSECAMHFQSMVFFIIFERKRQ
jgi:hypothetical protein